MPGPNPKANPARRNKVATRATLPREHDVEVPELPARLEEWHPLTVKWWADIWASPMAPEFEKTSDIHGLYILASLVDSYWQYGDPKIAAEIRLQRRDFGLTPLDRRRLQWEIERTDEAQARGERRRSATKPPAGDPRAVLRAVQ